MPYELKMLSIPYAKLTSDQKENFTAFHISISLFSSLHLTSNLTILCFKPFNYAVRCWWVALWKHLRCRNALTQTKFSRLRSVP